MRFLKFHWSWRPFNHASALFRTRFAEQNIDQPSDPAAAGRTEKRNTPPNVLVAVCAGLCLSLLPVALAAYGAEDYPAHSVAGQREYFAKMPLPDHLPEVPRIDVPIYAREAHIWFHSPHGSEGVVQPRYSWSNQGKQESRVLGPSWLRDNETPGQPLIGLYNSGDREVIRWQLRNAKNAGIKALFVPLHPAPGEGLRLQGESIFTTMLEVAEEEDFKVAPGDEVMFRRGWDAQKPEVFAKRAGEFIRLHGRHPGFLRIDGMPVYEFQFFDAWQHSEAWKGLSPLEQAQQMDEMLAEAERIAGESVYWWIHLSLHPGILALDRVRAVTPVSNSSQITRVTEYREIPFALGAVQGRLNLANQIRELGEGLTVGGAIYPGFDNSNASLARGGAGNSAGWIPHRGGATLVELMRAYQREGMEHIFLTSWNDWIEATNIEPGFDFHGYDGDPYLYLRIIAAAKGRSFTPAPLPPKEVVDPMFWEPLYGIDRTPPRFFDTRYVPLDPAVVSSVADSASPIARAWSVYDGDREWDGRLPERNRGLKITGGDRAEVGIRVEPGANLRIEVEPWRDTDSHEHPVYLVLEMEGAGFGMLEVTWPTDPPKARFAMEEDFFHNPLQRQVMYGREEIPTAVFKLYDWRDDDRAVLGLHFRPKGGQPPPGMPHPGSLLDDHSFTITRVLLFRELTDARESVEVGFAHPESQVKTFRFQTPPLQGDHPSAVYLFAEDAEGNRTVPRPVHGSQFRPVGVFPGGDGY